MHLGNQSAPGESATPNRARQCRETPMARTTGARAFLSCRYDLILLLGFSASHRKPHLIVRNVTTTRSFHGTARQSRKCLSPHFPLQSTSRTHSAPLLL